MAEIFKNETRSFRLKFSACSPLAKSGAPLNSTRESKCRLKGLSKTIALSPLSYIARRVPALKNQTNQSIRLSSCPSWEDICTYSRLGWLNKRSNAPFERREWQSVVRSGTTRGLQLWSRRGRTAGVFSSPWVAALWGEFQPCPCRLINKSWGTNRHFYILQTPECNCEKGSSHPVPKRTTPEKWNIQSESRQRDTHCIFSAADI